MRLIIYLFLLSITPYAMQAQKECDSFTFLNSGFEDYVNDCYNPTAFNEGCLLPWGTPQGSPNLLINGSDLTTTMGVSAQEGANFAGMATKSQALLPPYNCVNEALVLDLDFVENREYTVSFYTRVGNVGSPLPQPNLPIDITIRYTRNLANDGSLGGPELCDNLVFATNSPIVFEEFNFETDNWTLRTFDFIANSENDQLVFYPRQSQLGVNSYSNYWLIDNIHIEECDLCPQNPSAEFDVNPNPAPGNFEYLNVEGYENYDIPTSSLWLVLTSDTPNGPFSLYGEYATGDFPILVPEGSYHTIIHQLTICGETICYGQNHCANCGKNTLTEGCDYCGVIENCELPPYGSPCPKAPPVGLDCRNRPEGDVLLWDDVENAFGYEVKFSFNGSSSPFPFPGLCNGEPFEDFIEFTPNSIIQVPSMLFGCFCWKVRVVCPDGTRGEWSSSICCDYLLCRDDDIKEILGDNSQYYHPTDRGEKLTVSPNPSPKEFNIFWNAMSDTPSKLDILDINGTVIYSTNYQNNSTHKWIPSPNIPNGMYFIRLQNNKKMVVKRIILQR